MLNDKQIKKLIEKKDLIQDYPHLETQLQPIGFDLTVSKVFEFESQGALDFSNSERVIADAEQIQAEKENPDDDYGWWELSQGAYKVCVNEHVKLPDNLAGYSAPRSSVLRNGAFTQTAFWDAGWEGQGEFILAVENPDGLRLKENARIVQLAFVEVDKVEEGYKGIYQDRKE